MVRSENGEASKHPDHIPKLPVQATHPGMAGIGKVALGRLWPRVRRRLCWHCLCFFIAKNPWSAGRRSFVAASSKNTEVDSRVGALWLYVCRRVNRHALATPMRRPLPIAEGIRLALRLDTLVPKMTRPKCGSRLVSLTPGGGRLWRRMVSLTLQVPACTRPYGCQLVLRLDLCCAEEVACEVGTQRELEAAHGRQRRRLCWRS